MVVGPGCVFMTDRGHDLAQTIDVSVGYSEGLEFNLRATKLLQVGFGSYRGIYWTGLKDGVLDVWQEERSELGIGPLYVHEYFRTEGSKLPDHAYPLYGDPGFREWAFDLTHLSDRDLWDIGLTTNIAILGIDLALRPAEIADFFTGFADYDLLQDDIMRPSVSTLLERLSSDDARLRAAAVRALRTRFGEKHGYRVYGASEEMPRFQVDAIRRWREALEARPVSSAGAEPTPASP